MAVDKQALLKHHFWILMVPVLIGLFLAWFSLFLEVPDETAAIEAAYKKEAKEQSNVKAQSKVLVAMYRKQAEEVKANQGKMWEQAWKEQKDIFVWPKGYSEKQLEDVKDLKFGDPIPNKPNSTLQQFKEPGVYHAEYENLINDLFPMGFRDDNWKAVLSYIPHQWPRIPETEDAWLAMEDLWIQRDILLGINKVNRDAATFHRISTAPAAIGGGWLWALNDNPRHRKFRSRLWELDLEIIDLGTEQALQGSLKNISSRLQVTGINNSMILNVRFSKDDNKDFPCIVEGTSAEVGETLKIKPNKKSDINIIPNGWFNPARMEIFSVEQLFDLRTVPVKRVEQFVLGKLSDRNQSLSLRMHKISEEKAKKEGPATPTGPGPGSGPAPATATPGAAAPGQPKGEVSRTKSPNGLERNRYVDISPQCRRIPFGVSVVTEQVYLKDILESIANTKLRFQMTQVDMARYHGTLNYEKEKSGPRSTAALVAPPTPKGGEPPAAVRLPPGNKFRPVMPLSNTAPATSREDQFSANLLELSVYGILSLYERYEEPKAAKQAPVTPGKQPPGPGKQADPKQPGPTAGPGKQADPKQPGPTPGPDSKQPPMPKVSPKKS